MRRIAALVVLAGALDALIGAVPSAAQSDDGERRVLVIALPGLTWAEIEEHDLPALESQLAESAIADLAPRSVRHSSRPGDAYLTIGAGTRAIGDPAIDGADLRADADYFGESAGGVYERRAGTPVSHDGIVALGWPALIRANDREPYDVVLGLLGETLTDNGISTAVIANADGSDLSAVSYERQAALALSNAAGQLRDGSVDTALLLDDPAEPFGVRLDHEKVLEAFDDAWPEEGSGVVLVETSDLARTLRYRPLVDADRYTQLRADALQRADALADELLSRVDPRRDTVLVLGPYHQSGRVGLTVAGLRGPSSDVGYLESASTQRAGIVTLVDVAPSILDAFGIARPTDMEGRPFEIERSSTTFEHRVEHLVSINEASRFRERLLTPTTIALVLLLALLVAGAILATVGRWSPRWRRVIGTAALADLAALPVSYLARGFPLEDLGAGFYWVFLVIVSGAVALAASAIARRRRHLVGLTLVLAVVALVLAVDVLTGSNLHLSAAFGYSPTGNSRLYGISNYSFGQLAVASLLLAAITADRWRAGRGRTAAIALVVATLVVLGVPIWGSDVGGIIAFTPTILVFAAILLERRPNLRGILAVGTATVVAVMAFGFIDLARPAEERAHLGRLFERIGNEGMQPLLSIMERKLFANLRVSTSSFWVAAIPIAIACWVFLRWWRTRPLAGLHRGLPTLHAALLASTIAAVLGSLVNDSGAIVGGVASLVIASSLVFLAMAPEPP